MVLLLGHSWFLATGPHASPTPMSSTNYIFVSYFFLRSLGARSGA